MIRIHRQLCLLVSLCACAMIRGRLWLPIGVRVTVGGLRGRGVGGMVGRMGGRMGGVDFRVEVDNHRDRARARARQVGG